MAGFCPFSPRPCGDLWEHPLRGGERESPVKLGGPEPVVGPWAGTEGAENEAAARWLRPRGSPTWPPRRRGDTDSLWESHSLTHVARRPPDRARKLGSSSRPLEDAWGQAGTKSSPAWQEQAQPCPRCRPAGVDSSPPCPGGAYSPLSAGTVEIEKAQGGDRWAMPVCRQVGRWSPPSVHTVKSSVPSREFRTQSACVCAQQRYSSDRDSRPSAASGEPRRQRTQALESKLEEAAMSSRDREIVALVLTRLEKAQRMRELQQQAAAAWEELKRSDRQVQRTLEKERWLLLQQSQAQWRQQEQRKARPGPEQPSRRRDGPAKDAAQGASARRAPLDCRDTPRPQGPAQRLRELRRLQLRKRLEEAWRKGHLQAPDDQTEARESARSSLVNFQARKVLMDCQARAEELLRELSLEQSCQRSHRVQQGLSEERAWEEEERRGQGAGRRAEAEDPAEQRSRQAGRRAPKIAGDRTQTLRDLTVLRKNHPILKLNAEKEECHIEGIREAIKKQEQRMEQISQGNDPTFREFQVPRAPRRDKGGALPKGSFDLGATEAQPRAQQQRGSC